MTMKLPQPQVTKMKYKVLTDYATADGVLYADEVVKKWNAGTVGKNIRVKDNMGRIWSVPKNLLREVSNG